MQPHERSVHGRTATGTGALFPELAEQISKNVDEAPIIEKEIAAEVDTVRQEM